MTRSYMLESSIKKQCKDELVKWGWIVIHLIQTNLNGIPDTLCLRAGQMVWMEFKRFGKRPTPLQLYRHKQLRDQSFEVIIAHSLSDIEHLR